MCSAGGKAGVNTNNNYVFARAKYRSMNHVRGSDCLRVFSEDCGAKEPKLLRSTKLRKQIATLSQVLNLKDNEMDLLADFLGHDIRSTENSTDYLNIRYK